MKNMTIVNALSFNDVTYMNMSLHERDGQNTQT